LEAGELGKSRRGSEEGRSFFCRRCSQPQSRRSQLTVIA
jgi:hypothetical protein